MVCVFTAQGTKVGGRGALPWPRKLNKKWHFLMELATALISVDDSPSVSVYVWVSRLSKNPHSTPSIEENTNG
jgi:hypothetical protein